MRICLVLMVVVLCSGCLGGSAGSTARRTPPSHLGVAAAFPSSWSVTWRPCHDCADPRGIFIATSYGTTRGPRGVMCSAIPASGVAISLDEVLPGPLGDQAPRRGDYPSRPAAFHIRRLERFDVYEGCDVPRAHLFRFRDSGRLLYAWAVFGPHPSRAVRAQTEGVLNSLRIAPLDSPNNPGQGSTGRSATTGSDPDVASWPLGPVKQMDQVPMFHALG